MADKEKEEGTPEESLEKSEGSPEGSSELDKYKQFHDQVISNFEKVDKELKKDTPPEGVNPITDTPTAVNVGTEELKLSEPSLPKYIDNKIDTLGDDFLLKFLQIKDYKKVMSRIKNYGLNEALRTYIENHYIPSIKDDEDRMVLILNTDKFLSTVSSKVNKIIT